MTPCSVPWLHAVLLAGACTAAAQPEPEPGPALQLLPAGARVLYCGVSRGVLYVSYSSAQRAVVAPAFHTPAIREACARAGHALAAGPPARVAAPIVAPRIGAAPAAHAGGGARVPPDLPQPSFIAQASGSVIRIDGRNDADIAFHCVLDFAWTADGEPGGSRGVTTQLTLPARQSQRVVLLSGPHRDVRFVGLPRWTCRPDG